MSSKWYTLFGPKDWDGVNIQTGNKNIDGKYYNILSDKGVQLSASGYMWLTAGSGIILVSNGFVDASGIRAKTLQYENLQKINSTGLPIPIYPGASGSLLYKKDDNTIECIPGSKLVYNTGLGMLTMPNYSYGPLYVASGTADVPNTHEVKSYEKLQFVAEVKDGDTVVTPASITNKALAIFEKGVQIYPDYQSYQGSVLTHMGSGNPAQWAAAPYLKADGVKWNRYPKRPILIDGERIVFYKNKPDWAQDWETFPSTADLIKEIGEGLDTIEIVRNDTREIKFIKFASQIKYILNQVVDDNASDPELVVPDFVEVTITDPDTGDEVQGLEILICPVPDWPAVNGYAHSVTKGGYLDMQLGRTATDKCSCDDDPNSPFRFKPSTLNSISIRPNNHTAFNMLAENIDFVIYGQTKTEYNNYESSIFGLDSTNLPSGLIPAFRVDANVDNAASGNASSGVFYTKFIDREKSIASGWSYDTKAKITINTNDHYIIDSIPTGSFLVNNVRVTGYVHNYADLTVNSSLYSPEIISQDIYLRPKPSKDNSSKYITNALLTLDQNGKIISRVPTENAKIPSRPLDIVAVQGNGIGNGEISISWTEPSDNGGSDIVNYILEFSLDSGENWTELPIGNYQVNRSRNTSTSASILGLSSLNEYIIRVSAQNAVGIGPASLSSNPITPASPAPKAPYNLTALREFDNTNISDIYLSWTASDSGDSAILGYTIQESTDGGNTWQNYNTSSNLITDTSEVISGTSSNLDYYYRVSAWNYSSDSYNQSSFAYVYVSGNANEATNIEIINQQQTEKLTNWDFGVVLFTGVCLS
jgi:hypothetical protein